MNDSRKFASLDPLYCFWSLPEKSFYEPNWLHLLASPHSLIFGRIPFSKFSFPSANLDRSLLHISVSRIQVPRNYLMWSPTSGPFIELSIGHWLRYTHLRYTTFGFAYTCQISHFGVVETTSKLKICTEFLSAYFRSSHFTFFVKSYQRNYFSESAKVFFSTCCYCVTT